MSVKRQALITIASGEWGMLLDQMQRYSMWLQNNIHSWKVGLTDSHACSELTHRTRSNGRKVDTQLWNHPPPTQMSGRSLLIQFPMPASSEASTQESSVPLKQNKDRDGGKGWEGGSVDKTLAA